MVELDERRGYVVRGFTGELGGVAVVGCYAVLEHGSRKRRPILLRGRYTEAIDALAVRGFLFDEAREVWVKSTPTVEAEGVDHA